MNHDRRDGTPVPNGNNLTPGRDDPGQIAAVVLPFQDGATRKWAEPQADRTFERVERAKREWESTVDSLTELVCLVDQRGRLLRANRTVEDWNLGEVVAVKGRHIHDLLHPGCSNSACAFDAFLEQALAQADQGRSAQWEVADHLLRRCVLISTRPVLNRDHSPTHTAVIVVRDITERKRAEEAEREQRVLAEALRDTAAALNSTLHFDEVLDRILVNVGRVVPHDSATIMLISERHGVAQVVRWRDNASLDVEQSLRTGRLSVLDTPTLRHMVETGLPTVVPDVEASPDWVTTPQTHWVRSYVGAPIRARGKVMGFLNLDSAEPGFFTHIHGDRLQAFADQAAIAIENARLYDTVNRQADELEQHVAERTRELAQANERLRELDQLKTKFVSDVSHELRTPVTNMSLYLNLLERGKPEKREDYMSILKEQTARLGSLIEDILDLARLERDKSKAEFTPLDLNVVVEQVIGAHQPRAESAGLTLAFESAPDLPPIRGEHKQLVQVVTNLVANALNYTAEGGVQLSTFVHQERGEVCLIVQDTGMGIAPEDLPHVFERFYRGKRASQRDIPGSGLGLGIVKEIVELHKGTVGVESQVGEGSTFYVRFPPADVVDPSTGGRPSDE